MDIERYVEELSEQAGIGSTPSEDWSLRGHVVELWRCGDRFFLVADEAAARLVVERGIGRRGETWTAGEVEVVARISDQAMRDEVSRWKRTFDGKVRTA